MSVNPKQGTGGTSVTITGSGFRASTTVTVSYDGTTVTTTPAPLSADASGNISTTFNIPASAAGTHRITVSDGTSTLNADFSVSTTANMTPTSGPVGTNITASGTGYKASTTISINYGGQVIKTATSDTSGNFSTTFTIPASSTGSHPISITDGVNTESFTFVVSSTASMSPQSGFVGTDITLSGTGFAAGKSITVKYDNDQVTSSTSDAGGSFTIIFKTPASKGGNHVITVTDGTTTSSFNFSMDSTPPPVPTLVMPPDASKAEKTPTLQWNDVSDPSGVTYELQLATDATFADVLVEKTGLTTPAYQLTIAETLKPVSEKNSYYWRVRAIDGASNVGQWSTPFSFYIGFVLANWALYLIFGVVAVILGIVGFVLGRLSMKNA